MYYVHRASAVVFRSFFPFCNQAATKQELDRKLAAAEAKAKAEAEKVAKA